MLLYEELTLGCEAIKGFSDRLSYAAENELALEADGRDIVRLICRGLEQTLDFMDDVGKSIEEM